MRNLPFASLLLQLWLNRDSLRNSASFASSGSGMCPLRGPLWFLDVTQMQIAHTRLEVSCFQLGTRIGLCSVLVSLAWNIIHPTLNEISLVNVHFIITYFYGSSRVRHLLRLSHISPFAEKDTAYEVSRPELRFPLIHH